MITHTIKKYDVKEDVPLDALPDPLFRSILLTSEKNLMHKITQLLKKSETEKLSDLKAV